MTDDDSVLIKYNEIWNKIKRILNIKFHSVLIYDEKYIKTKVREFNDIVNTSFWGNKRSKEGMHLTCIACICIDPIKKRKNEELSTTLFRIIYI